jgi:hypothetical protein
LLRQLHLLLYLAIDKVACFSGAIDFQPFMELEPSSGVQRQELIPRRRVSANPKATRPGGPVQLVSDEVREKTLEVRVVLDPVLARQRSDDSGRPLRGV